MTPRRVDGICPPKSIFPFKSSDFSSSRRRKHAAFGFKLRSKRKI